jgi:hypothetical protein
MRLTKADKEMILLCLEKIWDCYYDRSYFEDHELKEEMLRQDLIRRFKKELCK